MLRISQIQSSYRLIFSNIKALRRPPAQTIPAPTFPHTDMPPLSAKAWEKRHSRKRGNGSVLRRNPGRGDGATWKSRGYICAAAVDGCSIDNIPDAEEYDALEVFTPISFSRTFSLLDGVQLLPSKRQRKAKSRLGDFEILGSNPKVIPVNDDCSDTDEDEWEKVDVPDISGRRRMTYSQVLQSLGSSR